MIREKDLEEIKKERDGLRSDFDEKIIKIREDLNDFLEIFNVKVSMLKRMIC